MGENRVHGFQNWGTHDFYTEYNNFQDTMITVIPIHLSREELDIIKLI